MSDDRIGRIRALNDDLRQHGRGGRLVITAGVQALGLPALGRILQSVAAFDGFSLADDPWGEHDCATVTVDGQRLIWKIDTYDSAFEGGSPDPSNPRLTIRVLTILLASED